VINLSKISEHAKKRWLELQQDLKGIDIPRYLVDNQDKVCKDIQETFDRADKVYRGQLGFYHTTADYYLLQDNVFVYDKESDTIVTIFKVNYDLPDDLNKQAIDIFRKALDIALKNEQDIKSDSGVKEKRLEKEIINIDSEIKRENNLISLLEQKKQDYKSQKNQVQLDVKIAHERVKETANCSIIKRKRSDYFWLKFRNMLRSAG